MIKALLLLLFTFYQAPESRDTLLVKPDILPVKTDTLRPASPMPERYKANKLLIPASLITAGVVLNGTGREAFKNEIVEERNEHWSGFRTRIDDYLQFSPLLIAYGLDAGGLKSKTDITNRTVIFLKGEITLLGSTHLLKSATHMQRPDGSGFNSFPSGHTAQAFAAATFLSEEYRHRIRWIPYAAYGIAASVGALRMANNKHYISDVLTGAGIGILSMKLAYWTHRYRWAKKTACAGPPKLTEKRHFPCL